MFISKRKFNSHKNRKTTYLIYKEHFRQLSNECEIFKLKYEALERAIKDYKDCNYLYEYLMKIKDSVKYLIEKVSRLSDPDAYTFNATMITWSNSATFTSQIATAVGQMEAALSLCVYMDKNELSLRK